MALAFNGSTGYLQWDAGTMPFTAQPFTLLAFVANNGATGAQQCIAASLKSDGSVGTFMAVDSSGGNVLATKGSATASKSATGISSSAFRLVAAEFVSNTSRNIYWDGSTAPGTDPGNDTGSIATENRICIGAYNYTSTILWYSGSIAEVHIINGALTAAELDAVKSGSIKPEQMTNWVDGWQLKNASDLTSMSGTRTLTLVGGVTNSALTHPVTRSSSNFGAGATLGAVLASGSLQSVMSGFTAGATLGAVVAGGSLGPTPGTFLLGPILVNGVAAAGAAIDWVRIYSDAGVLLYERTGGTLNGAGSTTLTTNTAPPGTVVRIDWQLSTGKRRMPRVTMG